MRPEDLCSCQCPRTGAQQMHARLAWRHHCSHGQTTSQGSPACLVPHNDQTPRALGAHLDCLAIAKWYSGVLCYFALGISTP